MEPISREELMAYADDLVESAGRRSEIEAYLRHAPNALAFVADIRAQNAAIRATYAALPDAAASALAALRAGRAERPSHAPATAIAALMVTALAAGGLGWVLGSLHEASSGPAAGFLEQAALNHQRALMQVQSGQAAATSGTASEGGGIAYQVSTEGGQNGTATGGELVLLPDARPGSATESAQQAPSLPSEGIHLNYVLEDGVSVSLFLKIDDLDALARSEASQIGDARVHDWTSGPFSLAIVTSGQLRDTGELLAEIQRSLAGRATTVRLPSLPSGLDEGVAQEAAPLVEGVPQSLN